MKYKNLPNRGSVRYIIFKQNGTWYGVALEFNLVEESDDPLRVMASLFQAIKGYVETVRKLKLRPMALNQKPDKEYEKLWAVLHAKIISDRGKGIQSVVNQKRIYDFGYHIPTPTTSVS